MTTLHYLIETLGALVDLAAVLLEICWLYLQLYSLRAEMTAARALSWIVANQDQSAAAAAGLCGSFLLASRGSWARLGWLAFLASNVLWIWYAWRASMPALLVQQIGFTATSLLGLWVWLIEPQLRKPTQGSHE